MTSRAMRVGSSGRRAGFTLLELIIVITVIVILVALVAGVGVRIIESRHEENTKSLLRTLDSALEEFIIAADGNIPPYNVEAYRQLQGEEAIAQYDNEDHAFQPDCQIFFIQARGRGQVDTVISAIPERYLRVTSTERLRGDAAQGDSASLEQLATPSVFDDFPAERRIIYVHPDNRLAQDLFGRCTNGRPYFMSAGKDGLYGLGGEVGGGSPEEIRKASLENMEDNIYSYTVGPFQDRISERNALTPVVDQ